MNLQILQFARMQLMIKKNICTYNNILKKILNTTKIYR